MIFFVAAVGKNNEMGFKGRLPWPRMAADIARLHALVNGKTIVTGQRTYEEYTSVKHAFSVGKVLVISHQNNIGSDAEVIALEEVAARGKKGDLWVIGGASIFEQLLPHVDEMFLTEIEGEFEADAFFPAYQTDQWEIIEHEQYKPDAQNPFPYEFLHLKRLV